MSRQRAAAVAAPGEVIVDVRPLGVGQSVVGVARQHFRVEAIEATKAVVSRLDLLSSDTESNEPIQLVVSRSE